MLKLCPWFKVELEWPCAFFPSPLSAVCQVSVLRYLDNTKAEEVECEEFKLTVLFRTSFAIPLSSKIQRIFAQLLNLIVFPYLKTNDMLGRALLTFVAWLPEILGKLLNHEQRNKYNINAGFDQPQWEENTRCWCIWITRKHEQRKACSA